MQTIRHQIYEKIQQSAQNITSTSDNSYKLQLKISRIHYQYNAIKHLTTLCQENKTPYICAVLR